MRQFLSAVFCLILLGASLSPAVAASSPGQARVPDLARIRVTDGTGATRPLSQVLPDGPVIVHVWATWCGPCRTELPALADFADALDRSGMGDRLVLVSVDRGSFGSVRDFLSDDLDLPDLHTWQEVGHRVGSVFSLTAYPTTVVLDADHRMVVRHAGALDWRDETAQRQLEAYLSSQP